MSELKQQEISALREVLEPESAKDKKVRIDFTPTPPQRWMFNVMEKNKNSVILAHRRMGKTYGLCYWMLKKALENDRGLKFPGKPPRYIFISPTAEQSFENVWDYLREFTSSLKGTVYLKSEKRIILPNRAVITVRGATNMNFKRGSYADGVILDEVAFMDGSGVWNSVIAPMLLDFDGFAVFSSTPAGRNFFYRIYKEAKTKKGWGTIVLPIDKTGLYTGEKLQEFLERQNIPHHERQQEYFCSFDAPLAGTYYGEIIRDLYARGRVGDFPYNPNFPVFTGWDIGIGESDSTSIWFAQRNKLKARWQMIDYECGINLSANDWARIVKAKEYNYAMHILPFDAFYRERGSGLTYQNYLHEAGLRNIQKASKKPKDTGVKLKQIEQTRRLLGHFDFHLDGMTSGERCPIGIREGKPRDKENGLDALSLYRSEYDEKKQNFSRKPRHDWTSHAADALRYMAMILGPMVEKRNINVDKMANENKKLPIEEEMAFWMDDKKNKTQRIRTGGIV